MGDAVYLGRAAQSMTRPPALPCFWSGLRQGGKLRAKGSNLGLFVQNEACFRYTSPQGGSRRRAAPQPTTEV